MNHDDVWRAHAACLAGFRLDLLGLTVVVEFDPDLWFPERGDPGQAAAQAKRVCAACPVREECLADALDRWEEFGIWGGAGEPARRVLRGLPRVHAGLRDGCGCVFCAAITAHFAHLDETSGPAARRSPVTGQFVPQESRTVSFGPGAQHGKASTYGRGCRCSECRAAKREHERAAKARRGVAS